MGYVNEFKLHLKKNVYVMTHCFVAVTSGPSMRLAERKQVYKSFVN